MIENDLHKNNSQKQIYHSYSWLESFSLAPAVWYTHVVLKYSSPKVICLQKLLTGTLVPGKISLD